MTDKFIREYFSDGETIKYKHKKDEWQIKMPFVFLLHKGRN